MSAAQQNTPERGLTEALQRLREWIERGDYQDPTAFADALDNLYRVEESHRRRLGDARYFAQRTSDRDGPVVGGIVYARGVAVHVGDPAATIEGRRPFTIGWSVIGGGDTLGGPGVELIWKAFASLSPPGRPETHGRDAMYQQRVAGRNVLATFQEASQFFTRTKAII